QAQLAARHETLTAEAEELARGIAAARLRELLRDRDRRAPSWREAEARQAEARASLDSLDARLAELEQRRAEAEVEETLAGEAHDAAQRATTEAGAALRAALAHES